MALPQDTAPVWAIGDEHIAVDNSAQDVALTGATQSNRRGAIIYVGVGGTVTVVAVKSGNPVQYAVPAGGIVPVLCSVVKAKGADTATGLVASW